MYLKACIIFHLPCAMTHNPQLIWFAVIAQQGKKVGQGQLLIAATVLDRTVILKPVVIIPRYLKAK